MLEKQKSQSDNSFKPMSQMAAFSKFDRDFRNFAIKSSIYIDRTQLIAMVIDGDKKNILIQTPPFWSKTLTLSMIKYFFNSEVDQSGNYCNTQLNKQIFLGGEIEFENQTYYKNKLNIVKDNKWNSYSKYMGSFQTVSLSFSYVKKFDIPSLMHQLAKLVTNCFHQRHYLREHIKQFRNWYDSLCAKILYYELGKPQQIDANLLATSLQMLIKNISVYHNMPCILIMDGFDLPYEFGQRSNCNYLNQYNKFIQNVINNCQLPESKVHTLVLAGVSADLLLQNNAYDKFRFHTINFRHKFGYSDKQVKRLISKYLNNWSNNIQSTIQKVFRQIQSWNKISQQQIINNNYVVYYSPDCVIQFVNRCVQAKRAKTSQQFYHTYSYNQNQSYCYTPILSKNLNHIIQLIQMNKISPNKFVISFQQIDSHPTYNLNKQSTNTQHFAYKFIRHYRNDRVIRTYPIIVCLLKFKSDAQDVDYLPPTDISDIYSTKESCLRMIQSLQRQSGQPLSQKLIRDAIAKMYNSQNSTHIVQNMEGSNSAHIFIPRKENRKILIRGDEPGGILKSRK